MDFHDIDDAQTTMSSNPSSPDSMSIKSFSSEISGRSGSSCEWEDQESFDTYIDKVVQLCQDNGFGEPSEVNPWGGGTYNCVIALTLPSMGNQDYILRVPRSSELTETARDQAAVLHYLAPLMPVPTVIAFDSTSDNAICCPYTIQQKLPGFNIAGVYYDLPLDEKLEIITLVADIIKKLNTFKMNRPGQLIAGSTIPSLSHGPLVTPTDIGITGYPFEKDGTSANMPSFEKQTFASHLTTAFRMRKNHNRDKYSNPRDIEWDNFSKIAKQMDTANLFSDADPEYVLWHWDLAFRNILVDRQTTGKWQLTGVLDWDMLLAVPLVLTRAAPTWLWCNDADRFTQLSAQSGSTELSAQSGSTELSAQSGSIEPSAQSDSYELTTDELYLKEHFDKAMQQADPNYMDDTYGRGLWIRRLAHFAVYGLSSFICSQKAEKLRSDWDEYYTSLGFDPFDEDDCDSLACSDLSISSVAPTQSSASLYQYEALDTYQLKIIHLCRDIGFGEPSKVERIKGGNSHRVFGLTFSSNSGDRQFILRIPRFSYEDKFCYVIRDQVATLLSLKQYDFLGVPGVAAVDTTVTNALESQYVFQHRVPGKALQDVFFELPLDEKLKVTTIIAQFLLKMEKISFGKPGSLTGTQSLPWTSTSLDTSNSPPTITALELYPLEIDLKIQSLPSLILKILEKRRDEGGQYQRPQWKKLIRILREMVKARLFRQSDSKCVLWHCDINAHQIFIDGIETPPAPDVSTPSVAEKQEASNSGWKVTGVIDWDETMSLPLVISRVPRAWLWFNVKKRGWGWDGDHNTPLEQELNQEELTIKGHFDQIMQQADPQYLEDTYGRGVWIRRIFTFANQGIGDGHDHLRCHRFLRDWRRYYKGLCSDTLSSD
ncbi:hypothetical protein DSL72_004222 [Monilinia vaccinii-corymbosi]|uniref:Aminoglycoside phosphotransferase domain-containing protein n=1 Tax=Monilinia vaccinii-corymbosi TaxID=61207 RepID=A0A8A3NVH1_9HELO|nr:hypothetical protein DSL72_004222 [Monilinia vaccinii-corymbosi]